MKLNKHLDSEKKDLEEARKFVMSEKERWDKLLSDAGENLKKVSLKREESKK
jgi:hypothetical protein